MRERWLTILALVATCVLSLAMMRPALAQHDSVLTPELAARAHTLASELRCVVCQNQTIADSTVPLAQQLKQEVRRQIAAGASDDDVRHFMVARYGEFILYRPVWQASTALLWGGPALLLAIALGVFVLNLRARQRQALPDDDPEHLPDADTEEAAR